MLNLLEFMGEHRATLTELCEPMIANLKDEFETVDNSFKDELIEEFQDECKLEIAEYISFYLGLDYVAIQETLEDVDIFTYLDVTV